MSREKLPVMIGKNLRKGLFCFHDMKMGGVNVCIVWLNKVYRHGDKYDFQDIDKIDTVLHFCDKESLKLTVDTLNGILKR